MAVSEDQKATRCTNCGASGTGRFCGECGAPRAASSNPYLLVADSFFKLSEIKRYIVLYFKILASPTKGTITTFEAGRLTDGVRFLEYSVGLYTLALAVSGLALVRQGRCPTRRRRTDDACTVARTARPSPEAVQPGLRHPHSPLLSPLYPYNLSPRRLSRPEVIWFKCSDRLKYK